MSYLDRFVTEFAREQTAMAEHDSSRDPGRGQICSLGANFKVNESNGGSRDCDSNAGQLPGRGSSEPAIA